MLRCVKDQDSFCTHSRAVERQPGLYYDRYKTLCCDSNPTSCDFRRTQETPGPTPEVNSPAGEGLDNKSP